MVRGELAGGGIPFLVAAQLSAPCPGLLASSREMSADCRVLGPRVLLTPATALAATFVFI